MKREINNVSNKPITYQAMDTAMSTASYDYTRGIRSSHARVFSSVGGPEKLLISL